MSLSKRIIACLDVRDGKVVKGVNFEGLREAGDPGARARRYNIVCIDEVVILDVTATIEARQARAHTNATVARALFLPLSVGGGIRTEADAAAALDRDAVDWAREATARGAGEILLTSIDRDGTKAGFDCDLTAAVSSAVNIPVIASGGAGTFEHFRDVFTIGRADAALAASIFHFQEKSVTALKQYLRGAGVPVRI